MPSTSQAGMSRATRLGPDQSGTSPTTGAIPLPGDGDFDLHLHRAAHGRSRPETETGSLRRTRRGQELSRDADRASTTERVTDRRSRSTSKQTEKDVPGDAIYQDDK